MINQYSRMSINTRLFITIGLVFVVAAMVIVALVNYHMRQQALIEAESKARILLDRNLATHTYFSHLLKPVLFELTEPIKSEDYFEPTWMSSTYAVREMHKFFNSLSPDDYYYKEGAINARSPENEAGAYEKAFLDELNANSELEIRSDIRLLDGAPYFITLRRGEMMDEACLRCHSTPDQAPGGLIDYYGSERSFQRQVGEVVSAISIRVPLSAAYAEANRFSLQLSGLLVVLLIGLFVTQFWLNKRLLVTPLTRIRDKVLQISTGSEHLGEDVPIPAGRELRDLTIAFNTMSSSLRRSQDHLEEQVKERTTELSQVNEQLMQEITERKRAEEVLKAYSERLEEMVEERTKELRDAQEQLVRREKLAVLGQLAGGVAHDLRNPLGVIKNVAYFLDIALEESKPEVKETLEILDKAVGKSNRIISSLLDFARPKPPIRQKVDINGVIREALSHTVPDAQHVEVASQLGETLPAILADPDQLGRVFENIIHNAIQAMPEGGRLVIESEVSSKGSQSDCPCWMVISVTDTGVGIPKENLGKIFEPLVTSKTKGIGLGLAITKSLVEGHGGTIEVESKEGKGSTFTVRFPLDRVNSKQ
jgi:signal transduction histidine kinase